MRQKTATEIARGYLTDSQAFLIAAQVLERSKDKRLSYQFSPRYYLLCHSLELILKSYILVSGGNKRELMQNDTRHNLKRLFDRASELGMAHDDPRLPLVIEMLAPLHAEHIFRYRKNAFITVPETKQMCKIVEKLIEHVAPSVNAKMRAQIAEQRASKRQC